MDEDIKHCMIDRVKFNLWMTAAALSRDKDVNPDGVRFDNTFERVLVLNEAGLHNYRLAVVAAISDMSMEKRLDFCR